MIFTDIRELKHLLSIDQADTSQDVLLSLFAEQASNMIEEALNRDFLYKSRTQYYNGTATQKLLLRNRPAFVTVPAPYSDMQVWVDGYGYYGSVAGSFTKELVYGKDYCLEIDQDDSSSRCGILVRINDYWRVPFVRQRGLLSPFLGQAFGNIKIVYTAGYSLDTLPAAFRQAVGLLVARMNYLFPLGMALSSEYYQDRGFSLNEGQKDWLLRMIEPYIHSYRNWKW